MVIPPKARFELVEHSLQRCGQQPAAQVVVANKKAPLFACVGLHQAREHAIFR
jgi:hypothetical protein